MEMKEFRRVWVDRGHTDWLVVGVGLGGSVMLDFLRIAGVQRCALPIWKGGGGGAVGQW